MRFLPVLIAIFLSFGALRGNAVASALDPTPFQTLLFDDNESNVLTDSHGLVGTASARAP